MLLTCVSARRSCSQEGTGFSFVKKCCAQTTCGIETGKDKRLFKCVRASTIGTHNVIKDSKENDVSNDYCKDNERTKMESIDQLKSTADLMAQVTAMQRPKSSRAPAGAQRCTTTRQSSPGASPIPRSGKKSHVTNGEAHATLNLIAVAPRRP